MRNTLQIYSRVVVTSHEVIAMMKKMGYMLGMGLGKEGIRVVEFPNFKT